VTSGTSNQNDLEKETDVKNTSRNSNRERKRAKFSAVPQRRRLPLPLLAVVAAGGLLVLAAALLWPRAGDAADAPLPVDTGSAAVAAADGTLRFPVSTFDDGQARFYTYDADGVTIEYFVLKSSDGVVRAAFNACDVCYGARLGYRQEGDEMVCNNCGQRFPSVLINEVRGGCNPAPLERAVEGDELVIRVADVLAGIGYFR
jgi:uncharacterized membrane protein